VNAIFVFASFLVTIPGIIMPTRGWLKLASYLVTITALFTLCIGLYLWILTLKTKTDFAFIWSAQPASVQDLMQTAVGFSTSI
jgi:hypothetical protein